MKSSARPPTSIFVLAAFAGLGALGAGCGDDPTGPEGPGEVDVVMTDENEAATGAGASGWSGSAAFSGTFEGDVRVEISTDAETWVELGDGSEAATVALQSDDATTVRSEVEAPGGRYSHIRLVMESAQANVEAGAVIDGVTYSEAVVVSVAGGSEVTVEAEVFPFTVGPETSMVVIVDLNSEEWVTSANVESGTAGADEVSAAVELEARSR